MPKKNKQAFKAGYVAIVGRPNVGKSTLLNKLLDFKVAAVTRKAQTTRHQIRGILNEDHCQIIFLDTPGLLQPKYKLQEAMLGAVHRSLNDADLVLFMIEAASTPNDEDLRLLEHVLRFNPRLLLIINKIDAVLKDELLPLMARFANYKYIETTIPISALKSDGLNRLKHEIIARLPAGQALYATDQITDHPERFLAAEIIREKVFQRYGEEIPYAITVEIAAFKERSKSKDFIQANIYVEKSSQKGILIGKKGAALREVGASARREIESLLGRTVYLELWVKVKEKWRQDERMLKEFGYSS